MHQQNTSKTFLAVLRAVEHIRPGVCCPAVYAEECQLSDERVGHNFECQCCERAVIRCLDVNRIAVQISSMRVLDIRRSRHEVNHCIQQLLDTDILMCRAAYNRERTALAGCLAERLLQIFHRGLVALEILLHQIVVQIADLLHHLGVIRLCVVFQIIRDIDLRHVLTVRSAVQIALHLKEVNDTLELVLCSDRKLHHDGIFLQLIADLIDCVQIVCSDNIHLIDERDTRNIESVCLMPDIFRLRFHTFLGREDADSAVKHTQRALDFYREIHVAGGINDINAVLRLAVVTLAVHLMLPVAGGSRRCNGDTTLLLLGHIVHGSSSFVCLTNLVVNTGKEQDSLCQSGLAGINMCHNTDVPGSFQGIFSLLSHRYFLLRNVHLSVAVRSAAPLADGAASSNSFTPRSEPVVRECSVRFCHLVHIFLTLHGRSRVIACVKNFARELVLHRLLASLAGKLNQPAESKCLASLRSDFNRNLIRCAADSSRLDFQNRHDVIHGRLKDLNGRLACLILNLGESSIYNLLRYRLLAVEHDGIDQLGNDFVVV